MILLTRILVPVDFSDTSHVAVTYGVALARQFKATLIVLHVEERHEFDVIVEGERVVEESLLAEEAEKPGTPPTPATEDQVVHSAARHLLEKILTAEDEAGVQVDFELCASGAGGAATEIMRFAKQRDVDLIVMGTRGRGFVEHMLMGSVAEKVVRHAPCPVLTVRSHEHEFVLPDNTTP